MPFQVRANPWSIHTKPLQPLLKLNFCPQHRQAFSKLAGVMGSRVLLLEVLFHRISDVVQGLLRVGVIQDYFLKLLVNRAAAFFPTWANGRSGRVIKLGLDS